MGKAYLTYCKTTLPGPLMYPVVGDPTDYQDNCFDEITLSGTSDTFDNVRTCPFKPSGTAMVYAPDDNAQLHWGKTGDTPTAGDTGKQLWAIPIGVPMFFNVPYGAYPAIKTLA